MNKTQKTKKSKRIAAEQRERKILKEKLDLNERDERDVLDNIEQDMIEDEVNKESSSETTEKDYYTEDGGAPSYFGPISFDELDAEENAREQANKVNRVSWQTVDLVHNIINNPMLPPSEKSTAIKNVGDGFGQRVNDILDGASAMEKDLDLLSIEAILAHDARQTSLTEKALDWLNKRTLNTSARNKLSNDQFALPEKRKYPIHDKAHVRNALARAAQQIKAGGPGAADAKAALPKIRAAAKRMGIEMDTTKEQSGIIVEKDLKGDWRWIGWCSNKYMDTDGEILSKAAHEEFTAWLDEHPEMSPVFLSWHTPETIRKNAVDFWSYENGFLIVSGVLTEDEAACLLQVQKEIDLGMSHGALVLARDPHDRKIITKYRMYEVSELPLENAANPFTNFETVVKEAGMDKKKYFESLFGTEKARDYLAMTKQAEATLDEAGVESKERKTTEPAPEPQAQSQAIDPKMFEALIKAVGEHYGMNDLNAYLQNAQDALERVPILEELVKTMAEDQDSALAEKITPGASGSFIWMSKNRASQSESSKLKEDDPDDEKLEKSTPHLDPTQDWLSAATGTQPVRLPS